MVYQSEFMKNHKPFVGQTVFLVSLENRQYERSILEACMKKIGRKYYTVAFGGWDIQFDIEPPHRQKTEYADDYNLFFTRQDAQNAIEWDKRNASVRRFFSSYHKPLTLDQLRRIDAILQESASAKQEVNVK